MWEWLRNRFSFQKTKPASLAAKSPYRDAGAGSLEGAVRAGWKAPVLEERYLLGQTIGQGGRSVVREATDLLTKRPLIFYGQNVRSEETEAATLLERFYARNPYDEYHKYFPAYEHSIAYGYSEFSSSEQAGWILVEPLKGNFLAKELKARRGAGGRSPREVYDLVATIFEALEQAHATARCHYRIHSKNIFLPEHGGAAWLLRAASVFDHTAPPKDGVRTSVWGPWKWMESSLQHTPERLSGGRVSELSDQYDLALVLVEMLTDKFPLQGRDRTEVHCSALAETRPTPRTLGVSVGPWEPVLERALALRPSDRFPTIGAFREALEKSL